ncbi:MAG: CopG family transcriptional regulator [Ignavibacteriaceae bacterium]|jgi:predicted DNA binding CopG/RHH family protein
MKKKMKYTDEKMGKIKIIKDFLPKPEELILKGKNVKVTLNLSKSSVDYFKKVAFKHGSQYQKVIRNLLDKYTAHFSE